MSYTSHLRDVFVPLFAKGEFNLYFISLLSVLGSSRSDIAQIATDLAVSFIKSAKEYGVLDRTVVSTVNSILSMFSTHKYLFSCLTGLSLFNTYFSGCIILDHVRTFLVQLTDIPASETHFFSVMKEFLRSYLSLQTEETKKGFVHMIYDIICPLSIPVRIILHEILEELGIKLQFHSWKEINTSNSIMFLQRLTLVYICGVEYDFTITDEIFSKYSYACSNC